MFTIQSVLTIGQSAIELIVVLLAPILGVTLAIGLVVSIFQAATQINEQSLSFIPKFIAVLALVLVLGSWMMTLMIEYIRKTLIDIPTWLG
jgi:flagellar biosynthetic protein FliQ